MILVIVIGFPLALLCTPNPALWFRSFPVPIVIVGAVNGLMTRLGSYKPQNKAFWTPQHKRTNRSAGISRVEVLS